VKFIETKIEGAFILEPDTREDHRGTFARTWCKKECAAQGLNGDFVQFNVSQTKKKGTIRGLHHQIAPHAEVKVIRCISGGIYDVIVDLRKNSPTFAKWFGVELLGHDLRSLYIPEGVAHGFQTLRDNTEVFYPATMFYCAEAERGIRWNDPYFNIAWPLSTNPTVSVKDQHWPEFSFDD